MSTAEIKELVNNASNLISLPEVALRVNQLANDPDSTADDMAAVITQDPALVVRMLKIANSAIMVCLMKLKPFPEPYPF